MFIGTLHGITGTKNGAMRPEKEAGSEGDGEVGEGSSEGGVIGFDSRGASSARLIQYRGDGWLSDGQLG
jgi:hypothetical protein